MSDNKQTVQEWAHAQRAHFTDEQIIAKLKEHNYSDEVIRIVMEPPQILPVVSSAGPILDVSTIRTVGSAASTTLMDVIPKYADIFIPDKTNEIMVGDKRCQVVLEMTIPRVVVIDDFMSSQECDELINVSRDAIARSTVIERGTGANTLDDVRTSSGMFHVRGGNEIVRTVEARISELIQWPVENGEGMQILRYGIDEKYEPHNDYFDPKDPGSVHNIGKSGQRIASVLIYLNDPQAGGATNFPDVGLEVKPRKGTLLFFAYPTHDQRSKTTHGGMPVIAGEKWVAVKWYRINQH